MDIAILNARKLDAVNQGRTPAMSAPGTKVYELIEKLNGRQIVKMDFGLKALQLLNAKTDQKIEEALGLFTDKQKDMMLKVLLKCYRGDTTTPEELLKKIGQ